MRLIRYAMCLLAFSLAAAEEKPLFDPDGLSLILGGNGTTTTKGPAASVFGVNIGLVQTGTLGLPFQLGVRQTFDHQRPEDSDGSNLFTTKLFYDVIFLKLGRHVDAAIGANCGLLYGDTPTRWQAGPEFGLRWWLRPSAAIIGRVDYSFGGGDMHTINYFIGIQVNLEKTKTK